jgi:ribonuclease VapC
LIVLDTSAVIAILQDEPEATAFLRCIAEADSACLSAVSFQEAAMVLAGRTNDAAVWQELDALIVTYSIAITPYAEDQALIARDAFLRFGKGRHPARLNCGDCASYALARKYNIPLLFKGGDFAHTDIVPALAAPA